MPMAETRKAFRCQTPALAERPQLSPVQAGGMAAVFKVLANDTRLRLLHALARAGEVRVTELGRLLGMKPAAVSNQLQRLADLGVVRPRRDGNNVYYAVADVCIVGLLDQAWCLLEATADPAAPATLSERAACRG